MGLSINALYKKTLGQLEITEIYKRTDFLQNHH
jgi:hypothetical protein